MRDRRQVTLCDDNGISLMATLWGSLAHARQVIEGTVMAIKGAKVSDYGGKSLNISEQACVIQFDPVDQPRSAELATWYAQNGKDSSQLKPLTVLNSVGPIEPAFNISVENLPYSSISQVKAILLNDSDFMAGQSRDLHHFKVSADLLQVQSQRVMWYPACIDCRKKINPGSAIHGGFGDDNGGEQNPAALWHCDRCSKHYDRCHWTWNFSMKLGDQSDMVYAQCLGDYPGTEILGMSAGELRSLAEADPNFQGW